MASHPLLSSQAPRDLLPVVLLPLQDPKVHPVEAVQVVHHPLHHPFLHLPLHWRLPLLIPGKFESVCEKLSQCMGGNRGRGIVS